MRRLLLLTTLLSLAARCSCFRYVKATKLSRHDWCMKSSDDDSILRRCVATMGAVSAPVGTLLDSTCHGMLDVLSYNKISVPVYIPYFLKTCVYTPVLFAVAGALMSYIILVLDNKLNTRSEARIPITNTVITSVVLFALHYYFSGLLDHFHANIYYSNALLSITAFAVFLLTDRSYAGLILAFTTAIGGTLIELLLVNQVNLYHYSNADFYGVDSWIYAVYFCGGPAIGNLARILYNKLNSLKSDMNRKVE